MSWCERWFLLILVELFTITQWVEMRGDICWYWWNCWPSLNELRWEVIFIDIGGLLTITQWVKVRGDFYWYWWNCLPSLNELRWEVMFADIGGIVDHHSMSWGEKWFLLILVELLTITQWVEVRWFLLILVELLTITQWVEVRDHFCWYWWNCWPSLNEFRREVIFFWWIFDHHSMNWGEMWFLLTLVELLTITQWVEVRGNVCWYWWNCWPSLNELRWEVIFVDIGGIVDHHSMSWSERWFWLILVEWLTITHWVKVRDDFCWYWWNCWHHSMCW
jgi:hypothetical protein